MKTSPFFSKLIPPAILHEGSKSMTSRQTAFRPGFHYDKVARKSKYSCLVGSECTGSNPQIKLRASEALYKFAVSATVVQLKPGSTAYCEVPRKKIKRFCNIVAYHGRPGQLGATCAEKCHPSFRYSHFALAGFHKVQSVVPLPANVT